MREQSSPLYSSLARAIKIYAKRLGVFLLIVCANIVLLGVILVAHITLRYEAMLLVAIALSLLVAVIWRFRSAVRLVSSRITRSSRDIVRRIDLDKTPLRITFTLVLSLVLALITLTVFFSKEIAAYVGTLLVDIKGSVVEYFGQNGLIASYILEHFGQNGLIAVYIVLTVLTLVIISRMIKVTFATIKYLVIPAVALALVGSFIFPFSFFTLLPVAVAASSLLLLFKG